MGRPESPNRPDPFGIRADADEAEAIVPPDGEGGPGGGCRRRDSRDGKPRSGGRARGRLFGSARPGSPVIIELGSRNSAPCPRRGRGRPRTGGIDQAPPASRARPVQRGSGPGRGPGDVADRAGSGSRARYSIQAAGAGVVRRAAPQGVEIDAWRVSLLEREAVDPSRFPGISSPPGTPVVGSDGGRSRSRPCIARQAISAQRARRSLARASSGRFRRSLSWPSGRRTPSDDGRG
jgi:hypothetical protein